jgi:hypothetical protein
MRVAARQAFIIVELDDLDEPDDFEIVQASDNDDELTEPEGELRA